MLDGIALAVGEVVHRVDAPLVPGAMVMRVLDAVEDRVAEEHVRMSHVYLGTEHLLAVGIFSVPHFAEEFQVLFYAAVAPGALGTGGFHGAATLGNLFLGLVVNIGQAALYELFCPFVELIEIVGSVKLFFPLETEPLDVFFDGIHVFGVFFCGVGIVVAEIGLAAIFLCKAEVDAKALGVPQMQVAIRLRREAGEDGFDFAGLQVVLDNFFKEIEFSFFFHCFLLY